MIFLAELKDIKKGPTGIVPTLCYNLVEAENATEAESKVKEFYKSINFPFSIIIHSTIK